jgi:hypothetical protein
VYRRAVADGSGEIGAIRIIRSVFGLNPAEAKEVMLQACGSADSLDEHQERLAEALGRGLQALGGELRTGSSPPSGSQALLGSEMTLSKADLKFLSERVQRVDPALRDRFEKAYRAWKESIQHPLITVSSNPASRTHTPEFLELISLGSEILPLLMERLTNPEEFFALQAVDRLVRPEFVASRAPDDPAVLRGEQGRALETVKQWVRTEA